MVNGSSARFAEAIVRGAVAPFRGATRRMAAAAVAAAVTAAINKYVEINNFPKVAEEVQDKNKNGKPELRLRARKRLARARRRARKRVEKALEKPEKNLEGTFCSGRR